MTLDYHGLEAEPCVFPFKYDGEIYENCTTVGYEGHKWCAKDLNSDGTVNFYGICACKSPDSGSV